MTNHLSSPSDTSPDTTPVNAPGTTDFNPNQPSDNPKFTNYYAQNNFIGAGVAGEIVDSQRCSIINGANNLISGKYNAHVIGDYMGLTGYTDIEDNSFNVGCHNGMVVYGDVLAKRRIVSNSNIEVGPGTVQFAFIDLKNDLNLNVSLDHYRNDKDTFLNSLTINFRKLF